MCFTKDGVIMTGRLWMPVDDPHSDGVILEQDPKKATESPKWATQSLIKSMVNRIVSTSALCTLEARSMKIRRAMTWSIAKKK